MIRLATHSVEKYLAAMEGMGGATQVILKGQKGQLPRLYGSGSIERFELRPGFDLLLTRYGLKRPLTLQIQIDRPMFSFGCILEGNMTMHGGTAKGALRKGDGINMWASHGSYSFEAAAGVYHAVSLEVSAEFLAETLGDVDLPVSRSLDQALVCSSFQSFVQVRTLSSVSRAASGALLLSSDDDPLRSLLLESNALSILREQLVNVTPQRDTSRRIVDQGRSNVDRLEEARKLLINSPQKSPSIFDLARQVGMNECSLKRGFRARFGMTVYECLRSHRMQIADAMLRTGHRNVSETATAVGYKNSGRFAMAFRREFGVGPKERQIASRRPLSPVKRELEARG